MTTRNKYINRTFIPMIKLLNACLFSIIVITLLTGGNASAQDRTITLNDAIKLGIQNSKVLKLSQSKIDEAVSQYNQAKDRSLPSGSASFGYNRAEIPANVLDLGSTKFALPKNDNAYLGILSVNQVIFGGSKLKYATESTNLLTQVSRLDADNDKDQIT